MTLLELLTDAKLYLRMKGPAVEYQLKKFINESIKEFAYLHNWERLKASDTITLDGTGYYTLDSSNLTNNFLREIKLITPYDESSSVQRAIDYTKYNYENYIQFSDKSYKWSIFGNKLYIAGDSGDVELIYITTGDFNNYPMSDDGDEVPATLYYPEIIQQWTVVKFLKYLNEEETLPREKEELQNKLILLKRSEKTGEHSGKMHNIRR